MHIERIHPETNEWYLYYANHICRYIFAKEQLKLLHGILDIACGVGYGTKYLSDNGISEITGVDISKEALNIAQQQFSSHEIEYVLDDASKLKVANQKQYNGIISFETLEHLKNTKAFLKNIYSILNENCPLIISTPNVLVTDYQSKNDWHYHEKEYTPEEFVNLINEAGFSDVQFYGQQYTQIGKLRNDLRHEINVLRSNPFMRFGMWFQKKMKKHKFAYPLAEHLDDFEIVEYNIEEFESLGKEGPFVLIIVAKK